MPKIQQNKQLQNHNTFALPCQAQGYICITDADQLQDISPEEYVGAVVLWGGSNILLPEYTSALVVHMQIRRRDIQKIGTGYRVTLGAGEPWDEIVRWSLDQEMYGLENLASIPGTIGASPIQNIGAYGKQVQEYIESVEVFDTLSRTSYHISNQDCQFGYRDSIFKKPENKHLIVISVIYILSNKPTVDCRYEPVATLLSELEDPVPQDVYDIVQAVRGSKLPDIQTYPNTGSTFKNPVISQEIYDAIITKYPETPSYPQPNETYKIPAGWLLDKAGWRGKNINKTVWSYHKQALVLYNTGQATQQDAIDAIKIVQESISTMFGIQIEAEVQIIPKK